MHREPLPSVQFFEPAANALANEIRRRIQGEVGFDSGSRALYATDASNYRQVPIGVVIPRSKEDVVETIAACKKHDAPVLSRGGSTSLAGQCCLHVRIDYDLRTAVFRDEVVNLFPYDQDARRLQQQTYLLSEFLERKASHFVLSPLHEKAIVHGHCHHKALMKMDDEEAVLKRLALDYQLLDSGCCGMAGGFGFEKDKYAISIQIGEQGLLPAVRQAAQQTLIIADGYSCREQIAQTTDRRALHLAEVIELALKRRKTHGGGAERQRSTVP